MTFKGHPRTSTPQWRRTRTRVLDRYGWRCAICANPANEVDHILAVSLGGTDAEHNLQALCTPHHKQKTAREANAARQRIAAKLRRPKQPHPGLRRP